MNQHKIDIKHQTFNKTYLKSTLENSRKLYQIHKNANLSRGIFKFTNEYNQKTKWFMQLN